MSSSKKVFRNLSGATPFLDMLLPLGQGEPTPARKTIQREAQEAQQQAARIGTEAGFKIGFEKGEREGREIGLARGFQESQAKFAAEHDGVLEQLQARLQAMIQETQANIDAWYGEAEESLADLAKTIAEKAIQKELEGGRECVLAIARETLKEVRRGQTVRIRVNAQDVAALEAGKAQLLEALAQVRDLEITNDPSVQVGVILETEDGLIDGRIETYLDRLEALSAKEAA